MTDREKIIETLKQTSDIWKEEEPHGYIVSVDLEEIADALIEAGIGDVKEAEMAANRYEMLYKMQSRDMALSERKTYEAEHRAEVAERAFKELCIDKIFGQNDEPSIKWTWDFYKARAEKELAEEKTR